MRRTLTLATSGALFVGALAAACGQSKQAFCAEHERLTKRMSELIVFAAANPKNFDEAEFESVSTELAQVKKKLEDAGSSGRACP